MARTTLLPGEETWLASDAPTSRFSAVFEDDGETGYFYAWDRSLPTDNILDALHIYDVRAVRDREIESAAEIVWSADGMKAALLINGRAHAVLDFEARQGYCRSNFPPPGGAWHAPAREPWRKELLNLVRRA